MKLLSLIISVSQPTPGSHPPQSFPQTPRRILYPPSKQLWVGNSEQCRILAVRGQSIMQRRRGMAHWIMGIRLWMRCGIIIMSMGGCRISGQCQWMLVLTEEVLVVVRQRRGRWGIRLGVMGRRFSCIGRGWLWIFGMLKRNVTLEKFTLFGGVHFKRIRELYLSKRKILDKVRQQ